MKNWHTQPRLDRKWESKREGATRASKVTDTQKEAWKDSQQKAKKAKGEAVLKPRSGKIRERSSYGSDPLPPKG